MNTELIQSTKRNYGTLTEISKAINLVLGDRTSRTVSARTAHGLKCTFDLDYLSNEQAEDIAHLIMALAPILTYRKNNTLKALGLTSFALLFLLYQNGK